MGLESLQSQTIDWLRLPLAVAVVFIHSFGQPAEYDLSAIHANPLDGMSIYTLLRICFSHALTHIAVPTFFLISGFLFFRKIKVWNKDVYTSKMKSRWRTLVVPYLLWNLITILSVVALKVGAFFLKGKPLSNILVYFEEKGWLRMFWDCNVWAEDRLNYLGMATPMTGPINLPLWFLRDLIVVTAITPIIYWFVKRTRHYGLLLIGLSYVTGIFPNIHSLNITALFFFSVGAYFGIFGKNMVEQFRKLRYSSYVAAILFLIPLVWFDGRNTDTGYIIYPFYIISGVCAIVNLASQLLSSGKVRVYPVLSQSTFFIYATHTILILGISSRIVKMVMGDSSLVTLTIGYFITPILATSICICVYLFIKHFMPGITKVFMGNR